MLGLLYSLQLFTKRSYISRRDHAYELMPPRLVFTISVDIEEQQYTLEDKPYWRKVTTLTLGPHRRVASSATFIVSYFTTYNVTLGHNFQPRNVSRPEMCSMRRNFTLCLHALQVKAEYIADFHPDSFTKASSLLSKYVIIPDIDDVRRKIQKDRSLGAKLRTMGEAHFMTNSSEWLVVDQNMVTLGGGGNACDKMGVSYSDFKWQADFCSNKQNR